MSRRRACCCGGDGGGFGTCAQFLAECAPPFGSEILIRYRMSYSAVFSPLFGNGCGQLCSDQRVLESGSFLLSLRGIWTNASVDAPSTCGLFPQIDPHFCCTGNSSASIRQQYNCIDPNWLPTGDPCADNCPPHLPGTTIEWNQSLGLSAIINCAAPIGGGARWSAFIGGDGTGRQQTRITYAGACCDPFTGCPPPYVTQSGPTWNSSFRLNSDTSCAFAPPPCGTLLPWVNAPYAWAWRLPSCSETIDYGDSGSYAATISYDVAWQIEGF